MSNRDDVDKDPPVGDEFDELLAAMQTYHDPERLGEFATRIPELIFAVRRAREDSSMLRASIIKMKADIDVVQREMPLHRADFEEVMRERDDAKAALREYEEELVDLRQREEEATMRALTMHGKLMETQGELFALHDAVFDHNMESMDRTVEGLMAANERLRDKVRELLKKRGTPR